MIEITLPQASMSVQGGGDRLVENVVDASLVDGGLAEDDGDLRRT
jgi:hypothetical protein